MRTLTTIVCDVSVDFDIDGAMIEESGLEAGGTIPELHRPHHQWLWAADQCWAGGAKAKLDIVGSDHDKVVATANAFIRKKGFKPVISSDGEGLVEIDVICRHGINDQTMMIWQDDETGQMGVDRDRGRWLPLRSMWFRDLACRSQ